MAVPKKRTSKSKKNIRKNAWKQKALVQAKKALFLAKYVLTKQGLAEEQTLKDS